METPTSSSRTHNTVDSTSTTSMTETESQAILLRIRDQTHKPGWRGVHTSTGEHVDHVLQLDNLKDFEDASVAAIYAEAQTLEEAPPSLHTPGMVARLTTGQRLLLSAPDMKVLSSFLARATSIIRTGCVNRADVPADGDRPAIRLNATLSAAGFCDVERWPTSASSTTRRPSRFAVKDGALRRRRACGKKDTPCGVQFPGMGHTLGDVVWCAVTGIVCLLFGGLYSAAAGAAARRRP